MIKKLFLLFAFLTAVSALPAEAYTLTYDVAQLNADFDKARRDGGGMPRFSRDIQKYMNDLSLSVDGVKLAVGDSASKGGCTFTWNAEYEGIATLDPSTRIEFIVNSLKQPIIATLDISGRLDGYGKLRGGLGFRLLGHCFKYATMQYSADIDADFKMWLSLVVNLNPEYNPATRQVTLKPTSRLVGEVRNVDVSVSNSFGYIAIPQFVLPIIGPVSSIFDALVEDLVSNKLHANQRYQDWLALQNINIQQVMVNNGFTSVVLTIPPKSPDEATKLGVLYLTEAALSYPVPWQYLEQNSDGLMFAALINDKQAARSILAGAAACTASNALRSNMPKVPIYQKAGTVCQIAPVTESNAGIYYSDSACSNANIQLRTYADICDEHFKTTVLGDAATWGATSVGAQTGWTYAYASQFNIGFDDLSSQSVPLMKRVAYKKLAPVYERKHVSVFNQEAFQAAMNQCNTRYYYATSYCTQTILPASYNQTMLVGSTIFDSSKYSADVGQCSSTLQAGYLANPAAYNYKYGQIGYNSFGQRYLTSSQLTAISGDCNVQVSAASDYATKYSLAIEPVGTMIADAAAYSSYTNYCTVAGPVPPQMRSYSFKGQTLACMPLRPISDPIWIVEAHPRILRGNGTCMLEMRIFKKNPNATNLKPLIMFHGGSWNRRSGSYAGLEAMISFYTERDFVVFTPFYRLAADLDGNTECNGSYSRDIAQDSLDAFNWVKTNGTMHGAVAGARPRLWGQSAGAYLAAYVVGNTTYTDVEKALLLYPPTDPISYAEGYKARWQAAAGATVPRSLGDDAMEGFLDAKLDWYVSTDSTLKDKFIAAASGMSVVDLMRTGSHAPVYMVHGNADDLVPVQQSILLCNAMGGMASTTAATYSCGASGSKLTVVNNASHLLDLCIDNVICPVGDKAAASQALQNAKTWFVQ